MNEQGSRRASGAAWVVAWLIAVLALAGVLRHGTQAGAWAWLIAPGGGIVAMILTLIVTLATDRRRAVVHRLVAVVTCSVWMTWVALAGWSITLVVVILGWAAALAVLEWLFAPATVVGGNLHLQAAQSAQGARPAMPQVYGNEPTPYMLAWQAMLRRITGTKITVTDVQPWENDGDGEQVMVDLPEKMTVKKLADYADDIAGGAKLPQGCVVRVLEATHQGAAILDVMKRDCLADERMISEPTTPASITDPFELAASPKGEAMEVCLREKSMVVGGTTGSGKTTLLHRIIFRLARCVDALIWIIDLNGGGLASLWLGPYARGEVETPTIDWVADCEEEAAVMGAVAIAIAKDRKTNRESIRRKRAANSTVVPVDKKFPAIVVITDEGGEIRQAIGLLAALVDQYIARIAQIGRAEAVRVIQSVLRGTADLLAKELRTVLGIRICLRMDEEGEYDHVLGKNPGRTRLLHKGSAYLYRTDTDYRPVLVRTVNVDIAAIEAHAIATAGLRPTLDDRAKLIASRVTVADVLDGRDPSNADFAPVLRHSAFVDTAAGLAYENRWKRKKAMLAQLRDEDLPEEDEPSAPQSPSARVGGVVAPGSRLERLAHGAGVKLDQPAPTPASPTTPAQQQDYERVAQELLSDAHLATTAEPVRPRSAGQPAETPASPQGVPAATAPARELILWALADARPTTLTLTDILTRIYEATKADVSKQRAHELLKRLVGAGEVVKDETRANGPYYGLPD